jgi:YesN/AraC family two-component response regulator
MPKIDGFELYTKLREQDSKVKICFLTAITTFNEDFRQTRMTLGKTITEDYFIQKTIKNEDLIKKLTSIMNLK